LPDQDRGAPPVITATIASLTGHIEISGTIGDQPWSITLPLAGAAEGQGLSKVWARRKIADAEVALTTRAMSAEQANAAILKLALEHSLVTRLTSLVAVDNNPSRPEGVRLTRAEVPINLPEGWDFDLIFGTGTANENRPTHGTPDERRAEKAAERKKYAALPVAVSAAPRPAQAGPAKVMLPRTATDAKLRLWFGLLLCLISLLLIGFGRGFARLSR
jgi:Ca-activated chloride channel family protein